MKNTYSMIIMLQVYFNEILLSNLKSNTKSIIYKKRPEALDIQIKKAYTDISKLLDDILIPINSAIDFISSNMQDIEKKTKLIHENSALEQQIKQIQHKMLGTYSTILLFNVIQEIIWQIKCLYRFNNNEKKNKLYAIFMKLKNHILDNRIKDRVINMIFFTPNPKIWLTNDWIVELVKNFSIEKKHSIRPPQSNDYYEFTHFFCLNFDNINNPGCFDTLKSCNFNIGNGSKSEKENLVNFFIHEFEIYSLCKMTYALLRYDVRVFNRYRVFVKV